MKNLRLTSAVGVLLTATCLTSVPTAPRAQGNVAADASASPQPTPDATLIKHLPAGHDELVFRGENSVRSWTVYMTRTEANRIGEFRLAMLNTVSIQPDRSTLTLSINGHILATPAVRSSGKATLLSVRVPPGVLVPGFNAVQISSALAHRVDCSLKATYELWALLDPAQTGFVVPPTAAYSGRSVADIAGEPLSADGATRIHVRLAQDAGVTAVEAASRLVTALVAKAHITRPVVDVGPEPGIGPGLDLIPAALGDRDAALGTARVLLRQPDLTLARDPRTNRLLIAASDPDDRDVAAPDELLGSDEGLSVLRRQGGRQVLTAGRVSFADLGMTTDVFSGHRYLRTLRVDLPTDFYPGSYDKVRLLIDGAHSSDLNDNSSLVFRVNGALVSSLKLQGGTAEQFQHEMVELPLRFFRPGSNEIQLEGLTTAPADAACDLSAAPNEPRLMLAGTSEVEIPYLAHLSAMPQIAGAMPSTVGGQTGPHDIYLPDSSPLSIGLGLTVAANIAAQGPAAPTLRYHLAPPSMTDEPGVVLGAYDGLPKALSRAVGGIASARPVDIGLPAQANGSRPVIEPLPKPAALSWVARAEALFREHGFFFAATPESRKRLTTDDRTLLVASVSPEMPKTRVAGIEMPGFTSDPRQWLVFTGKDASVYSAGIDRLVTDGLWSDLNGQAVALDVDDGRFDSVEPGHLTYVMPKTLAAADIRPIMGGLVSANLIFSGLTLIFFLSLLGFCTHVLVRSGGKRPR